MSFLKDWSTSIRTTQRHSSYSQAQSRIGPTWPKPLSSWWRRRSRVGSFWELSWGQVINSKSKRRIELLRNYRRKIKNWSTLFRNKGRNIKRRLKRRIRCIKNASISLSCSSRWRKSSNYRRRFWRSSTCTIYRPLLRITEGAVKSWSGKKPLFLFLKRKMRKWVDKNRLECREMFNTLTNHQKRGLN